MITVKCDTQSLPAFQFNCDAPTLIKATLRRKGFADVDLTPSQGAQLPLPPPETPDGIYQLHLDTECGCFITLVNLNRCETPSLPSTHDGTGEKDDQYPIIECCDEQEGEGG